MCLEVEEGGVAEDVASSEVGGREATIGVDTTTEEEGVIKKDR